ncbi:hypothetical protein [Streptomyces mirabilis]|uniref:hypothetical protein n=1 Tax=Streptomyces mirabilis TaxID=68239 RepID=UPI0036DF66CF
MSDQSSPEPPDYWAVVKRISEARKKGRSVDARTVRARMDALAARRKAQARAAEEAREAQLRAAVDKAVREALGRPEFGRAVSRLTEAAGAAPAEPVQPGKPLYEMTAEEWRAYTQEAWTQRLPQVRRPMTINEWIASGYEDEA